MCGLVYHISSSSACTCNNGRAGQSDRRQRRVTCVVAVKLSWRFQLSFVATNWCSKVCERISNDILRWDFRKASLWFPVSPPFRSPLPSPLQPRSNFRIQWKLRCAEEKLLVGRRLMDKPICVGHENPERLSIPCFTTRCHPSGPNQRGSMGSMNARQQFICVCKTSWYSECCTFPAFY